MSEFKYACPVCGQHIKCDLSQAGTVMECPTCFQKITVPQAPSSEGQKFIITGTKVGERPAPNIPEYRAAMPGKNSPMAAVLVLLVLACAAGVAVFAFRGKLFKPAPSAMTITNSTPVSQPVYSSAPAREQEDDNNNNLALNKPVSASSAQPANPPQNGNDGKRRTRWCAASGSVPQWWEVDLGAMTTITNAQTLWEHTSVYRYAVELSANHSKWTVVVDKSTNSTAAKFNSDSFSATGRYVRIVILGLERQSWASFYEFRVLGSTNISN